jgi:surface antigen
MRVASVRMASVVALALIPMSIAACSSDKGAGSLLGSFSYPLTTTEMPKASAKAGAKRSGAVIGGIGSEAIGRAMSTRERTVAAGAEYRALEYGRSGAPVAWDYPALGHRGEIVPGRPYKRGDQYCRTFTHTVERGDAAAEVKGIACREGEGVWRATS